MLYLDKVTKYYPTRHGPRCILRDVTFSLRKGQKLGILGCNGAGKSTLIRLIGGVELPTSGTVRAEMTISWPLAFQGGFVGGLTGIDNLRFICRVYDISFEKALPAVVSFSELGSYLYEPVVNYSSGMFDLDGVLIDSKENMRTAWDATREKFGLQPTFNDYLQLIGRPFCDLLTLLGIQEQQEAIFNYYNTISAQYVDCITPYEGAYDFLAFLRGKNILTALITSKSKVRLDAVLRKISHPFSCVLTPEDGLRGKPAPDHLLLACLKLGVDPAEAVYLGDMVLKSSKRLS